MARKIFICHSTDFEKEPNPERDALELVREKLAAAGYEILVDQGLKAGDLWFEKLFHWIAECHGAVALLGERAVGESKFVRFELSCLVSRTVTSPSFVFYPLLLSGVGRRHLGQGDLKVLELGRYQVVSQSDEGWADTLVKQFTDNIPKSGDSPGEALAYKIRRQLKKADVDEYVMDAVREGVAGWPTVGGEDQATFARQLASARFADVYGALRIIKGRILDAEGATAERTALRNILHYVTPVWAPEASVAELGRTLVAQRGPLRVAVPEPVDGQDQWSRHSLIARLHTRHLRLLADEPPPRLFAVLRPDGALAGEKGLENHVVDSVVAQIVAADTEDAEAKARERLEALEAKDGHVFILIVGASWFDETKLDLDAVGSRLGLDHPVLCVPGATEADVDLSAVSTTSHAAYRQLMQEIGDE